MPLYYNNKKKFISIENSLVRVMCALVHQEQVSTCFSILFYMVAKLLCENHKVSQPSPMLLSPMYNFRKT